MSLYIKNDHFVDESNRTVLLRGISLSGSSKIPYTPNGATHLPTNFSDYRNVSFINRPLKLEEAETHLNRIRNWGFNAINLIVCWEAIEHSGPNLYDVEFLEYLEELGKYLQKYQLYTIICPHQDVWSRMTGGDGAPGWTLEKIGIDITKLDASEAAFTMQHRIRSNEPESYTPMVWMQNSLRYGCATMNTLFYGGTNFAPSCKINGVNIQNYLQDHFINAFKQVAQRMKHFDSVVGYRQLNDLIPGWIGMKVDGAGYNFSETIGYALKPIDAICLASGFSRMVPLQELKRFGIKKTRQEELNKEKISAWKENMECIWKKENVWQVNDQGDPIILDNDYFIPKGMTFYKNFAQPFLINYFTSIQSIDSDCLLFFEYPLELILRRCAEFYAFPSHLRNMVHATTWYDLATMGTRRPMIKANFDLMTNSPVVGQQNVQKMHLKHQRELVAVSEHQHNNLPTIIGEFNFPFDLNKKDAYNLWKSEPDSETIWDTHELLLNMYYNAIDSNLLGSFLWNYTPDNENEWGDQWNYEDFSIYSRDQVKNPLDLNSGGRAIKGFCRPHYIKCMGTPLVMQFNNEDGTFRLKFELKEPIADKSLIIFIPKVQYPNGFRVHYSTGHYEPKHDIQEVHFFPAITGAHEIIIYRN